MTRDCLRTGDEAGVHFRFIKNPEYLRIGQRMVFREGRTKAIGNIVRLIPDSSLNPFSTTKGKMSKQINSSNTAHEKDESKRGKGRQRGGSGSTRRQYHHSQNLSEK